MAGTSGESPSRAAEDQIAWFQGEDRGRKANKPDRALDLSRSNPAPSVVVRWSDASLERELHSNSSGRRLFKAQLTDLSDWAGVDEYCTLFDLQSVAPEALSAEAIVRRASWMN